MSIFASRTSGMGQRHDVCVYCRVEKEVRPRIPDGSFITLD